MLHFPAPRILRVGLTLVVVALLANVIATATVVAKPVKSATLVPASFDYGSLATTQTKDQVFTFTNTGTTTVRKPAATVTGTGFRILANPCATAVLGPNGTCTVTVRYTAGAAAASGTLTVTANRTGYPSTLTGGTPTIPTAVAVSPGYSHTCALDASGGVWCWGRNDLGQLGLGDLVDRTTATAVPGMTSGFTEVVAGQRHTCAIDATGGVWCWGANDYGQLGDLTTTNRSSPVRVSEVSGATALALGYSHTCAAASGAAICWGNAMSLGINNSSGSATIPTQAVGLESNVTEVQSWHNTTCALASGELWCWGDNSNGQVGIGGVYYNYQAVPANLTSRIGSPVTSFGVGFGHVCAVVGGAVTCWGANLAGQIGQGSTSTSKYPTPVGVVDLSSGVTAVAVGYTASCATVTGGAVKCWGANDFNQTGNGTTTTPQTLATDSTTYTGLTSPSGLRMGVTHVCAIVSGGGIRCWGKNDYGQLGNGTTADSPLTPVAVTSFP
ncbi:MAG: hypothetical protein RL338_1138 [Chloroflexota bacterium]